MKSPQRFSRAERRVLDASSGPVAVADVPEIVKSVVAPLTGVVWFDVTETVGRTLAQDLRVAEPLPSFDQCAVDGYAFFGEAPTDGALVAGVARAGQAPCKLPFGGSIHVMTGAPLPIGADRVAAQEKCCRTETRVVPPPLEPGANIRRRGEDVGPNDLLASRGTRLDARHVALLSATGQLIVPCFRPIKVALVATGNELADGVPDPGRGQIRDSNSPMLAALLSAADVEVEQFSCADDADAISHLLGRLAADVDLIITIGGMSFGVEDHVRSACVLLGGTWALRAVAMKPGKPVGLARLGSATVLGLPGNPFAALVAFLVVGREVLARLRGCAARDVARSARAGFVLDRRPGRDEFFPARVVEFDTTGAQIIERLGKGGSARLAPLVAADGLGRIEAGCTRVDLGDPLDFLPFETALQI